jgi:exopolyphosphatase/guanosine-5'-triphosphate,3'-diphosphate pyrophosphatase
MVRLGEQVFLQGKLSTEAMARTLSALKRFKSLARTFHITQLHAFGTSALRESANSWSFLRRIRNETQISVEILSGMEEARLIAKGVLSQEPSLKGPSVIVDVGGGSTELIFTRNRQVQTLFSFPLGSSRLHQMFIEAAYRSSAGFQRMPILIQELKQFVFRVLDAHDLASHANRDLTFVGTSGTVLTLAKLLSSDAPGSGARFTTPELKRLVKKLSVLTRPQLLAYPGLEPKRADLILAGALLLLCVAQTLKVKRLRSSPYSLRDGILLETVSVLKKKNGKPTALLRFEELETKAAQMGANVRHFIQVSQLAEALFDRFRRLHRLSPDWKPYLRAACVLHDVGEVISHVDHAKHTYYVVKHLDFPALKPWEREFVAQLCLHHSSKKIQTLPDLPELPPKAERAYPKLLALLRLAVALDKSEQSLVQVSSVVWNGKSVGLRVKCKNNINIDLVYLHQSKKLFEKVFGKELWAQSI